MKKILIAEDQTMLLKSLTFKLKHDGYEVITAADGRQAKDMILSESPDLVISDIMMPFVTGLELIKIIRDISEKYIPIIVLSSMGSHENTVLKAFDLGADDFMTKPFSPNELSVRVKKLLK